MGQLATGLLSLSGWAALAALFTLPALETPAFLGLVLPGELALLLGGVLAHQDRIPLAVGAAGALAGDTAGSWIGRHWGPRLLSSGLGRRVGPARLHTVEGLLLRGGGCVGALHRPTAAGLDGRWLPAGGDLAGHTPFGQHLPTGLVVVAGVQMHHGPLGQHPDHGDGVQPRRQQPVACGGWPGPGALAAAGRLGDAPVHGQVLQPEAVHAVVALLLRRPATSDTLAQGWPAAAPWRQVRLRRPDHLADPDRHACLSG
jgi:hypothetical protein